MIMVDSLISNDEERTCTAFFIKEDTLFMENGLLTEEGLIENMAQSAALRTGWMAVTDQGGDQTIKPQVGVIGSVKNFILHRRPAANTEIVTEIEIQAEVFNATMVMGKVMQDQQLLAEAELKIFLEE